MIYKIKISNKYDSSKLLFSIPVHENQQIINNHIENILNYNPNSKIMLHVNKSFKTFDNNLTNYHNVFINSNRYNYKHSKGLLWIHVNNFLEAIRLDIDFEYFIIISSNEMFIKYGLNLYIEDIKNGAQIVNFDLNNDWHNFHKNLENDETMIRLLKYINLDSFYGGQTEGQFYEKNNFKKISDIYIKIFGDNEIHNFETEEVITQTIFKSFNISYGLPFTLQNYSNNIVFDEKNIENIRKNNFILENNKIKYNLISPHVNNGLSSIFSIKRVDRTFNNIRYYLTISGFILNKDIFQLNTLYYLNNSCLVIYDENSILLKKKYNNKNLNYNWFGYEVDKGYYIINFDIKISNKIKDIKNIGLKMSYPSEMIYNFFLEDFEINTWKNVSFPIFVHTKQNICFIFDNYIEIFDIELKNIYFDLIKSNSKKNIAISLYNNLYSNISNDCTINYNNIFKMIIEPFSKIYNIYIFNTLLNNNHLNQFINNYKPNELNILNNIININDIFISNIDNINNFKEINNINFNFIIFINSESIFKKNITQFNFYINKINFLSYHIPYINNEISNSYDFMSFPEKYILKFYHLLKNNIENKNICYSIYSNLKDNIGNSNFNFILDDNYLKNSKNPLIKYLKDTTNIDNNKGFLITNKYLYEIFYKNNYSKILKNINGEIYFYKKNTIKYEPYQWIGIYLDFLNNNNTKKKENIKISFNIKLLKKINKDIIDFGLKIHEPLEYFKNWIDNCILNEYTKIEINTTINRISQYIILNFDDYYGSIEFYIKDFEIKMDYD